MVGRRDEALVGVGDARGEPGDVACQSVDVSIDLVGRQ
jgi:hypothetical protein